MVIGYGGSNVPLQDRMRRARQFYSGGSGSNRVHLPVVVVFDGSKDGGEDLVSKANEDWRPEGWVEVTVGKVDQALLIMLGMNVALYNREVKQRGDTDSDRLSIETELGATFLKIQSKMGADYQGSPFQKLHMTYRGYDGSRGTRALDVASKDNR